MVQPAFDIGARAVQVLLRRIRSKGAESRLEKVRLPATLVVRESSSGQCNTAQPLRRRAAKRS